MFIRLLPIMRTSSYLIATVDHFSPNALKTKAK